MWLLRQIQKDTDVEGAASPAAADTADTSVQETETKKKGRPKGCCAKIMFYGNEALAMCGGCIGGLFHYI